MKAGDLDAAALTKIASGCLFHLNAQYPEAAEQYQEALDISTATNNSSIVCWTYLGLASSLVYLKEFEEAEEFINQALAIAEEQKNGPLEVMAYYVQAGNNLAAGRMKPAERLLRKVIGQARELKMTEIEKKCLINLSYYYIKTKDYDNALDVLTASKVFIQKDTSMTSALRNMNLYATYEGKEEYDKAYEYLEKGGELFQSLDFDIGLTFYQKSLADHYKRKGKYKLALEAFQEYQKLSEAQTGEAARKELQALKAKQEFREKDWEIERLTQAEQESALKYRIRRNMMAGLLIGLSLLFALLYFMMKYKARIKLANQNKAMAETRLQVLQSQINPHFIFNALTGIQNSVLKSETIEAYNYLGKFSDILRVMATTATSISIPLVNEIELIDNYLALEKLRFRDGFIYSVDVSESLKEELYKVPGMLVQPVVENAIIHGVSNLTYQGKVHVFFQQFGDGVKVIVTDNGRGRNAAAIIAQAEAGKHLSIATENSQKTLKALHTIGYKDADIQTLDLFHKDGTSAGTQVTIYLPFLTMKKTA
jgi:tetratricopeptide (TPR) repeat protein